MNLEQWIVREMKNEKRNGSIPGSRRVDGDWLSANVKSKWKLVWNNSFCVCSFTFWSSNWLSDIPVQSLEGWSPQSSWKSSDQHSPACWTMLLLWLKAISEQMFYPVIYDQRNLYSSNKFQPTYQLSPVALIQTLSSPTTCTENVQRMSSHCFLVHLLHMKLLIVHSHGTFAFFTEAFFDNLFS